MKHWRPSDAKRLGERCIHDLEGRCEKCLHSRKLDVALGHISVTRDVALEGERRDTGNEKPEDRQ